MDEFAGRNQERVKARVGVRVRMREREKREEEKSILNGKFAENETATMRKIKK